MREVTVNVKMRILSPSNTDPIDPYAEAYRYADQLRAAGHTVTMFVTRSQTRLIDDDGADAAMRPE